MPFGDGSLLAIDAWGQYYPMLCAMKEAIKSGELFWSYKGLLGFNLWAQNAYYTNSVLWLPLYLLPDRLMLAGINISAAIRIGLAGLTCSIYLSGCTTKKKPRGMDVKLPVFSAAYALSAYTLAFINQFMWMDAVICLPLVIKGIDNIRSKKAGILYTAALSYTIISNFYIGYMVCLFSVVYFVGGVIGERMSRGQLWEKNMEISAVLTDCRGNKRRVHSAGLLCHKEYGCFECRLWRNNRVLSSGDGGACGLSALSKDFPCV